MNHSNKPFPQVEQVPLLDTEETRRPCRSCGLPYGQCQFVYMSCYAPPDTSSPRGYQYLVDSGLAERIDE